MADRDLLQLARDGERRAWVDLFEAAPAHLDLRARPLGAGTVFETPRVDHLLFNRSVMVGAGDLGAAADGFEAAGIDRYMLMVEQPAVAALGPWLARRGLEPYRRPIAKLLRGRQGVVPEVRVPQGLTLRRARPDEGPALGAMFCAAFDVPPVADGVVGPLIGRPGWDVLVVAEGERVAGLGILYTHGSAACLVAGLTALSHRRRGVQGALVRWRVRAALERGARVITSETGVAVPGQPNSSWRNLERAGLRAVATYDLLCPTGTRWSDAKPRAAAAG